MDAFEDLDTPPSSVKAVTITHSSVQSGQQNLDALIYSGVMPRSEDMPRPSPPELATITRVFKVIFLGKRWLWCNKVCCTSHL